MDDDELTRMTQEVIRLLDETDASRDALLIVVVAEQHGKNFRLVTNIDNERAGKTDLQIAKEFFASALATEH